MGCCKCACHQRDSEPEWESDWGRDDGEPDLDFEGSGKEASLLPPQFGCPVCGRYGCEGKGPRVRTILPRWVDVCGIKWVVDSLDTKIPTCLPGMTEMDLETYDVATAQARAAFISGSHVDVVVFGGVKFSGFVSEMTISACAGGKTKTRITVKCEPLVVGLKEAK